MKSISSLITKSLTLRKILVVVFSASCSLALAVSDPANEEISLKKAGALSVKDFGAVGDGRTDDSAAFARAVANGRVVFVPYSAAGYKLNSPLIINKATTIIGLNRVQLFSGTETLFWITSWDVEITGFNIDMNASRAGTAAIYLDSSKQSLNRIRLSDLRITGAHHAVLDPLGLAGSNPIVYLEIFDVTADHARQAQISLGNSFAYFFLKRSSFSYSTEALGKEFALINLKNNAGAIFDKVKLSGSGGALVSGLLAQNSQALWFSDCVAENLGGPGFHFVRAEYLYFDKLRSQTTRGPGLWLENSTNITGFKITALNATTGIAGIWFNNVKYAQLTQVIANNNSWDGVYLQNSTNNKIFALESRYNKGWGLVETGTNNIAQGYLGGDNTTGETVVTGSGSRLAIAFPATQYEGPSLESYGDTLGRFDLHQVLSLDSPKSVMDFGARGDGVTDDTAAFNRATASGGTIYVPWTPAGYYIAGTVGITKPLQLIGIGRPSLRTGTESLFWIASSLVTLHNFSIRGHSQRAGTAAFYLDTKAVAMEQIRISEMIIENTFYSVLDANSGVNKIRRLTLQHLVSYAPRYSQIVLRDAVDSISLKEITISHVGGNTSPATYSSLFLSASTQVLAEDIFIEGGVTGAPTWAAPFFNIQKSANLLLNRCMADTNGVGEGFWISESSDLVMRNVVASLNRSGGFVLASNKRTFGINVVVGGTLAAPKSGDPVQAGLSIYNQDFLQFTNVSSRQNTGAGLLLSGGRDLLFNNYQEY